MIGALEEFRKYRQDLQTKMEAQLCRMASMDTISTDLSEKFERYLGKETFEKLRVGQS
jgi:hypothetical protein